MSPSDVPHAGGRCWPHVILSGRPFLGTSALSKDADFDCLLRFSRPEPSAAVMLAAARQGAGAIMPMNDANLLRAMDQARAGCALEVYPVIPNVLGYVREATDYGMVGAGIRQLKRVKVADLLGIGMRRVTSIRRILARDFGTILSLLIELEMAAFKRFRPPLVFLHSQVTDIVVALKNEAALRVFADVIRGRFGAQPGVVTNNFGALLQSLHQWNIDIPVVCAPFNARGFLMKPTKQACESLLADTDRYIVADRIAPDAAGSLAPAFEYLQQLGIASAVVDIAAPAGAAVLADQGRAACASGEPQ